MVVVKIPSSEAALILILNCTLKKVVKDRVAQCVMADRCLGVVTTEQEVDGKKMFVDVDCDKAAPVPNEHALG